MKKIASLFSALIVIAGLLSGCTGSQEKLVIYTWENYIPPDVVAQFEKDTGIKVTYATFSDNEEMYNSFSQKTNQYDIIVCSDYIIDLMAAQGGLLHEIDKTKIENYGNIDKNYQSKYYDPDNKYTIPHASGSAVLVYDSAKLDFEVDSYRDLWNEKLNGKVVLLDGGRDIIGITLQMLGYSVNETDPDVLELAKQELLKLKPNVVAFDADTPHEAMIRGDAWAGYMFPSQAIAAMEVVDTIKFAYPAEGLSVYIDNYVISQNAPNLDNAYKFIDYILDGEVSAKISSTINYVNCNTAARAFLPKEFLDNEMVNLPPALLESAEMVGPIGDADIIYNKIWTEFKSY